VSTPPFIDVSYAADTLHISPDVILDWVASGKLKTYGGRSSNPFVRSGEVHALAAELGALPADDEPPKRMKSASGRVQTRLTADAKWGDISDQDIVDWASRTEPVRRKAARTAASAARDRLDFLLKTLDGTEDSG